MSKHTEGPWEAVGSIVYFPEGRGGFDLWACPNPEGNAALCSAAPAMIEALELLAIDYHNKGGAGFDLAASTKMFAAINKAKGMAS